VLKGISKNTPSFTPSRGLLRTSAVPRKATNLLGFPVLELQPNSQQKITFFEDLLAYLPLCRIVGVSQKDTSDVETTPGPMKSI
jgi:hypothetical protein